MVGATRWTEGRGGVEGPLRLRLGLLDGCVGAGRHCASEEGGPSLGRVVAVAWEQMRAAQDTERSCRGG